MQYTPTWNSSLEGYTKKYASTWSYSLSKAGYLLEDLMQEGALVFYTCSNNFKEQESKDFMNLYKKSLYNHYVNIYNKSKTQPLLNFVEDLALIAEICGLNSAISVDFIPILIREAPKPVYDVFRLIYNKPKSEQEQSLFNVFYQIGAKKGTRGFMNNPLVCKTLGYPRRLKIMELFKNYITEDLYESNPSKLHPQPAGNNNTSRSNML